VFLFAGFLPLVSTVFGYSRSLLNEYQDVGSMDWIDGFTHYPVSAAGLLLLLILWPIALILSIVSVFRRQRALIAGIIGIICWAGAAMYISGLPTGGAQYGAGTFTGFAGAIIMIVAYYIKLPSSRPQAAPAQAFPPQAPSQQFSHPPPPPPTTVAQPLCPTCGQPLTFIQEYNKWYCYNCNKYP